MNGQVEEAMGYETRIPEGFVPEKYEPSKPGQAFAPLWAVEGLQPVEPGRILN